MRDVAPPSSVGPVLDGNGPVRRLRVAVYPQGSYNPYIRMYAESLKLFGIDATLVSRVTDSLIAAPGFDAVHLHWGLEQCWRVGSGGAAQPWRRRARRLARMLRLLGALKQANVKVLWTAHELEPPDGGDLLDRLGYLLCARSADLCIAHSEYCRSLLRRRFWIPARRILTTPHPTYEGVLTPSEPRADTLARWNVPPERKVLLCFGGLRPRKGVSVALDAIGRLDASYHLILQGGPAGLALASWHRELMERALREPRVTVIGETLGDEPLANLLNAADCVLLPYSRIIGSGGLTAALTVGRGVVASDLAYFREALRDAPAAAVLCRPGDPTALAAAIDEFFALPRATRENAARTLGKSLTWRNTTAPVAAWLRREANAAGDAGATGERPRA